MPRLYLLLLLVGVPLAVVAAPVPAEAEKSNVQRVYGTWTDPDNDCKFKMPGGELRVAIPATDHSLGGPLAGPENAPRALREVDGDFTAVVRVSFPIPERGPKREGKSLCSGGLLAWAGKDDYVVVRRCAVSTNGVAESFWGSQQIGILNTTTVQDMAKPESAGFVRLKREGDKVIAGWSRDAKTWEEFDAREVDWGDKVKVGIVAENIFQVPFEVTFDRYELTQPKK
jgi:hypothetical protein